jgi:hypothetical protein
MTSSKGLQSFTKGQLLDLFSSIDDELRKREQVVSITVIGGASLILQDLRDRSTVDIDIVNRGGGAELFVELCADRNVPVDVVSVLTTIDFNQTQTIRVFDGIFLKVDSILAEDIIRSKLERFRKQDPEDIYVVIGKTKLSYDCFKSIIQEMLVDYIGNTRELWLSAMIVVEEMYPERAADFAETQKSLR